MWEEFHLTWEICQQLVKNFNWEKIKMLLYYVFGLGQFFTSVIYLFIYSFNQVNTVVFLSFFLFYKSISLTVWTRLHSTEGHIWKTFSLRCSLFSPLALWRPARWQWTMKAVKQYERHISKTLKHFSPKRNTQWRLIVSTYWFLAGLVKYVTGQRQKRLQEEQKKDGISLTKGSNSGWEVSSSVWFQLTSSTLMLDFALVSKNLMPWSFASCQDSTFDYSEPGHER